MPNTNVENRLLATLTLTGETLYGTPEEIVTALRETAKINFETNENFMRQWADRARLFSKEDIDFSTERLFVESNIRAGFIKIIKGDSVQ